MGPIPIFISYHIWLVVSTPLKNMSSSVGMIIPNIWKKTSHVPNHQPDKNPIFPCQNPKQTCQNFPTRYGTEVPQCLSLAGIRATGAAGGRGIHRHFADVADNFWGVQSSRTGRFNHQKIYGFIVLGSYGAIMMQIMIWHELTNKDKLIQWWFKIWM